MRVAGGTDAKKKNESPRKREFFWTSHRPVCRADQTEDDTFSTVMPLIQAAVCFAT